MAFDSCLIKDYLLITFLDRKSGNHETWHCGTRSQRWASRNLTTRHQIRSWAKRVRSSANVDSTVSPTNKAWPGGRKCLRRYYYVRYV